MSQRQNWTEFNAYHSFSFWTLLLTMVFVSTAYKSEHRANFRESRLPRWPHGFKDLFQGMDCNHRRELFAQLEADWAFSWKTTTKRIIGSPILFLHWIFPLLLQSWSRGIPFVMNFVDLSVHLLTPILLSIRSNSNNQNGDVVSYGSLKTLAIKMLWLSTRLLLYIHLPFPSSLFLINPCLWFDLVSLPSHRLYFA